MAARSSLLLHGHDPVLRSGHRAAHEEEIPVGVDLHDAEAEPGVALGAVMAGHLLALDHARRIGARPDGARLPVPRVAVGPGAAAEPVPVHDALEAAALRGAGDLHHFTWREDVNLHLGAGRGHVAV